jgi:addiction module HigA family antidote
MTKFKRKPTTPGEILKEEFLIPLGITQSTLAGHIGCDIKVINRIVNGKTSISAGMALKLGSTFRTTADFWMNAQKATDLYHATKEIKNLPEPITKSAA